MKDQYVQGYTDEVDYCPYCGGKVYSYYSDGSCECSECNVVFFVIESEKSNRRIDHEED